MNADEPPSPRRRGRPPLDPRDGSVSIHLRVPARQYDLMDRAAQHAKVSVPEIIRRRARRAHDDDR